MMMAATPAVRWSAPPCGGSSTTLLPAIWTWSLIALIGTINPSSGDVSLFLLLEQAQLTRAVTDRGRTALFARYSLVGSLAAAIGALAAGLPDSVGDFFAFGLKTALQAAFLLYALLGLAALLLYRRLPAVVPGSSRSG